ncbi:HAMP domain-containing methyl-accepting chemotaxis protein [Legionella septentrionalis]|uniref:HAMP domain-containing methyl-accepting chemotaxis protein n=1 Tax=Legionella septentrionalis TaxID=2498109 RepID=UPI000F8F4693|nr:methyl-accepting chemotaxis protein [Legionella septentrionalis]RUQ94342.1 methyl-accepting chemotaxis protein [Legionella septentrionalis]
MDAHARKSHRGLSIRGRLIAGFLLLSMPLFIVMLITLVKVESSNQINSIIQEVDTPTLNAVIDLDGKILTSQRYVYQWLITGNERAKTNFETNRQEMLARIEEIDELTDAYDYPNDFEKLWNELKTHYSPLFNEQNALFSFSINREDLLSEQALVHLSAAVKILDKMLLIIQGVRDVNDPAHFRGGIFNAVSEIFIKDSIRLTNNLVTLKWLSYGLLMLAIVLTAVVPFLTARSIVRPLNQAIDVAQAIASGKRHIEIPPGGSDEVGKLLQALKSMHDAIVEKEKALIANEEKTRQLFETTVQTAQQFSEHTSKVSAGDLRERIEVRQGDLMEKLGKDLNTMTDNLAGMAKKIMDTSQRVIGMVDTIKSSANEQSTSITEQASAISEISASLEEIDKSSKKTIEKAQSLRDAAKSTYEQGKKGKESVQQVIEGMNTLREKVKIIEKTIVDLNNHTQQISEITSAVTTLAQQSKMLALNASIEAAKAGEAGKGFAVVANEVKNLAEQSEQATTQVQKILEEIRNSADKAVIVTGEGTKTVDAGSVLIANTAEVINSLSELINTASILSQQMEAAIRQEGIGIEQITASMNEINQATSSFVVGIKQTTEVINRLAEMAEGLKKDVDIYRI